MATDDEIFGVDLDGIEDVDFEFSPVRDPLRGVAQAVARRWLTRRGSLWYDQDYGYGVGQHLGAAFVTSPGMLENELEQEALKDERVASCSVRVTFFPQGRTLKITGALVSVRGPVTLTLTVSELTAAKIAIAV
jgi:hypothetical protein